MVDFLDKAKKFGEYAADKAGDVAEIGKLKARISSRKSDIVALEKKIGKYYYDNLRNTGVTIDELEAYYTEIDELSAQILDCEAEIERIKEED